MVRSGWFVLMLVAACGGDDGGGEPAACQALITGDVTATDTCQIFFCPTETFESLHVSSSMGASSSYVLESELDAPTTFTAGQTYTLETLNSTTSFSVTANGKTYLANGGGATRDPGELGQVIVQAVHAPPPDTCNGYIDGFIVGDLVEYSGGTVGPGRVHISVTLGAPR